MSAVIDKILMEEMDREDTISSCISDFRLHEAMDYSFCIDDNNNIYDEDAGMLFPPEKGLEGVV